MKNVKNYIQFVSLMGSYSFVLIIFFCFSMLYVVVLILFGLR